MFSSEMGGRRNPPEDEPGRDLLAEVEEAEFAASVRAARERAAVRSAAPTPPFIPDEVYVNGEIEWNEQPDVYRPKRINACAYLTSLGLASGPRPRVAKPLVLVKKAPYEQLCRHLRSDVGVELGGLLCGEALYDEELDLFVILVEAALPATNGNSTATSFSYTPAAWEAILPGLMAMNPDWTIIGSYHSHPGMGVFMSATDTATQAEVFSLDWQIALVMDPVDGACGLFAGASGRPCAFIVI